MKIPVLLLIIATLVTAFIPFSGILTPLALILSIALLIALSVRSNVLYTVFSAAFSGGIVYLLSNSPIVAISLPLTCLISAISSFLALKKKATLKEVVLSGTAGFFALIAAVFLIYGKNLITDVLTIVKNNFFETLDGLAAALPTGTNDLSLQQLSSFYELFFETLIVIAPSIILSVIFVISYFSLITSRHFAKSSSHYINIPAFSDLHTSPFLLLAGLIAYFGQLVQNAFISGLMSNLFMVLSVYFTVCGFSLIDFFVKSRIKSLPARLAIYIGITILLTIVSTLISFANPVLIAILAGIMDGIFNYRLRVRLSAGK